MKRFCFLLIFCLSLFPIPARAGEIRLTLDEVVSIALRDNRDIILGQEELTRARASIAAARSSLFPQLNAGATLAKTRGLYATDRSNATWSVGASQLLYAGGKVINAIKAGEHSFTAAQAILDKTRMEIVYNTKRAFYTLVFASEYASVNKRIVQNTLEHLAYMKQLFANGRASETDLLEIESSLSNVRQALVASESQVQTSQALLSNLLHLHADILILPEGKFEYEPKEVAYDQAFIRAMKNRPEIRQYEAQEKAAKNNVGVARADSRPTVAASWDYYGSDHLTAPGGLTLAKNRNDYNVVGVSVSWPVFDGWLTKAKVESALVDLKETRLLADKAGRDIAYEVKTSYLELKNAVEMITYLDDEARVQKSNYEIIRKRFDAGMASMLDLNDAALSYAVAQFKKIQGIYDYFIAKAKFERATGGA